MAEVSQVELEIAQVALALSRSTGASSIREAAESAATLATSAQPGARAGRSEHDWSPWGSHGNAFPHLAIGQPLHLHLTQLFSIKSPRPPLGLSLGTPVSLADRFSAVPLGCDGKPSENDNPAQSV